VVIILNESVDHLAKEASINGKFLNNAIYWKEITSSLKSLYSAIDSKFFLSESKFVGSYFLNNFSDINIRTVRKFIKRKEDCENLSRIITGYPRTNSYLFKMQLIESPGCCCDDATQNLKHIFWDCPILETERKNYLFY